MRTITKKDSDFMRSRINAWLRGLEAVEVREILPDEDSAEHACVFSADMVSGFCKKGTLASERIDLISQPITNLFTHLHEVGVRNFALLQEWHEPNAKEFESFPEHCVQDTEEAETIPELLKLPFADEFVVFRKNTFSPAWSYREKRNEPPEKTHPVYPRGYNPFFKESFDKYLEDHDIRTAIVVGNCTNFCFRELAMYLRMWANQHQKDMQIVIPENCVETFDLSVEAAEEIGEEPHLGNFHHASTLHSMSRVGIDIVKEIV